MNTTGQISTDAKDLTKAEEELRVQTRIQEMLTETATTFISLPLNQLDAAIAASLEQFGKVLQAHRICLFDYDFEEQLCINTHEWCAAGVDSQIEQMRAMPLAMMPDWVGLHRRGEMVCIHDVLGMAPENQPSPLPTMGKIKSLFAVPMMDDGRCLGFAGFDFIRDRLSFSAAEQKLLSVFAQMQANVHKRRDVEAALRASRDEAQIASRTKSDFLANMSHEIRTPMNGVIGMIRLLTETPLNDEQRHFAATAMGSAESLLALLNDILDLSKIEAGKMALESREVNLPDILDVAMTPLAMNAQEKGLEFVIDFAADVPARLHGDPLRLRQVLVNLVGNAVKFTAHGEVEVRVERCRPETSLAEGLLDQDASAPPPVVDDATVNLRFTVRDTGIGIPHEKLETLFNPFVQADPSTTRRFGGTGLGLAIARQLVGMMGGEIGVEAEEGKGSSFWFTARFAVGSVATDTKMARQVPELVGQRVLVVDDNAAARRILMGQLAARGMRPQGASDGSEAVQMVQQACGAGDRFRVALIDLQMSGMDGLAVGQALRADPAGATLSMVLMTPGRSRVPTEQLEAAGFSACLNKPIWKADLADCLLQVLSDRSAWPRPATVTAVVPELPALHSSARVLLVEDNAVNRMVAAGIMKKLGLQTIAVENGVEALDALARESYDLVLMDVQMAVMDGYEATRRIRAGKLGRRSSSLDGSREAESEAAGHGRTAEIPIIAMTAHAMQGDREKCLEAGMSDYITKPISRGALAKILQKWLPN